VPECGTRKSARKAEPTVADRKLRNEANLSAEHLIGRNESRSSQMRLVVTLWVYDLIEVLPTECGEERITSDCPFPSPSR
jgi:hypothetical protein